MLESTGNKKVIRKNKIKKEDRNRLREKMKRKRVHGIFWRLNAT